MTPTPCTELVLVDGRRVFVGGDPAALLGRLARAERAGHERLDLGDGRHVLLDELEAFIVRRQVRRRAEQNRGQPQGASEALRAAARSTAPEPVARAALARED